jgi:glycosyltransferase involved in cell wall biosynthesis
MSGKINITAPVSNLGYGVVGHNFLKEYTRRGYKVAWWPIGGVDKVEPNSGELYQKCIDNQELYNSDVMSLRIWHQFDLAQHVGKGLHCALPIFELDHLKPNEAHHLSQQDIVFATSGWHKKILLQCPSIYDKTAVEVVPLGVDPSIFYHDYRTSPHRAWTTFLNCGKWEKRKGHDVLIEAFNKAFEPNDRVRLWMLTHNTFLTPEYNNGVDGNAQWEKTYKETKMGDKISFLPRAQYHADVAKIMQEADCGVFPSRAEGWNLEALEMLACGRQVILTDYSAHTEYATPENSHLIDIYEREEAYDGKWFFGQGNWAKFDAPQVDQLVEHLRTIYTNKRDDGFTINSPGIQTASQFTWEHTVNHLLGALDE